MDELERWVVIHNEIRPDDPEDLSSMALLRAHDHGHLDLLALVDGKPVGTAMVAGETSTESGRPWVEVNVLPAYRGRGVGTALFREASDQARRDQRIGFACEVQFDDTYSRSFLERHGYVAERRWDQYTLDLGADAGRGPDPPEGVEVTSLADRPDLLASVYGVAATTYPELEGYLARRADSFLKWQVEEFGSSAAQLALTPLAVTDGAVVGFATMRTLLDPSVGEVRTIAVLPRWRRRGVATALLRMQISGARQAGMEQLRAWVSGGARAQLLRTIGFEEATSFIELQGPLF